MQAQFPNPPSVDGLPAWLQVLVSLSFVFGAIVVAFIGYKKRVEREPPGAAQTVLASIPDMSAVRQLTDVCRLLCERFDSLDATLRDHTHYMRDHIDVGREVCMRLRELKEEIARSDRQRFHGGREL